MTDPQPQEKQPEEGKPRVPHGEPGESRQLEPKSDRERDESGSPKKQSGDTATPG